MAVLKQRMQYNDGTIGDRTYEIGTDESEMDADAVKAAREAGYFDEKGPPHAAPGEAQVFGGYVIEENAGAPIPRPGDHDFADPEDAKLNQQLNPSDPAPHPKDQHPEDTGKNAPDSLTNPNRDRDYINDPRPYDADRDGPRRSDSDVAPPRGPANPDRPDDTRRSTSKLGESDSSGSDTSPKRTVGGAKKKKS